MKSFCSGRPQEERGQPASAQVSERLHVDGIRITGEEPSGIIIS